MRLHAEITAMNNDGSPLLSRPWRWVLVSLAGFVFWSAVIGSAMLVWRVIPAFLA